MTTIAKNPSGQREQAGQRVNFADAHRELHLQAFYAWLPCELTGVPGIDWSRVSSKVLGYFVNAVGDSPDAICVALAVGTAIDSIAQRTLLNYATHLHSLLKSLRQACSVSCCSDLSDSSVWERFMTSTFSRTGRSRAIAVYAALTSKYLPDFLQRVEPTLRKRLQPHVLPPLPPRFRERYDDKREVDLRSQQRRKERSDILVPLYHVLVALIQLRKQVAERMLQAYYLARRQVESGEVSLPYTFSYEDHLPEVNKEAQSVADVQIYLRPVTMRFLLWDRSSWVRDHPDRFGEDTRRRARQQVEAYAPDPRRADFFLQFDGPASDCLWFGQIIQEGLLRRLSWQSKSQETKIRKRKALALFVPDGFHLSRPGLLTPDVWGSRWLHKLETHPDELLFEPTSLYRGCLYGTALATMALTNGSRVGELLQVSLDRRKTRTEVVPVTRDGKVEQKTTTIHLQHLLPKGKRTEAERQLFLLSPQAVALLGEICQGLITQHGEVPVVSPNHRGTKYEQLKPERYLFQWGASSDGRQGVLLEGDVQILLRFMLYGLELYTAQGEPIRVSTHLLRHVTATVMREQAVPLEAIQWTLHHQPESTSPSHTTIPEATEYYSRMPQDKQIQFVRQFQLAVEGSMVIQELRVPDEELLQAMDEKLRAVFEQWGTINPTAFGYCGRTSLCPRGSYRGLCIGCPYLVPDPAQLDLALHWEALYLQQATQLRSAGSIRDALQAEAQARNLRDMINLMRLYQQAETDRQYVPFYRSLPKKGGLSGEAEHSSPQASSV